MAKSPLFNALLKELDYEWKPAEEIIATLTLQVPPGKALRARRQHEEQYAAASGAPSTRKYTENERLRMGARELINKAIGSARANGYIELTKVDGVRYIRLVRRVKLASYQLEEVGRVIDSVLSGTGTAHTMPLPVLLLPVSVRKELAETLLAALRADKETSS